LGLSKSPCEAFFESPQQPNTTLPCLVPVISPLCALRRPAEADSQPASAYGGPPAFHSLILSRTLAHSFLSPFSIASTPPFSRKMLAHIVSVAAAVKGRNSLPIRIAIPACIIALSSPAPDSPMAIYYALPHCYFQQTNA
jgi:hypothetical protein